jgi:predicted exporter
MKKTTALSCLYALFLIATLVTLGYLVKKGDWLQTDLRALLPQEQGWTDLQIQANQHQEALLNQQVIVLIGHQDPQTAFQLNENIAQQWQQSGLFTQVNDKMRTH